MSDFLVDFRSSGDRRIALAVSFLRFFPDTHVSVVEESQFSLVLSRCDDERIWGPYRSADGRILVVLSGRIALESWQLDEAELLTGSGGLACKAIYRLYRSQGVRGLQNLNGNYVALVHDAELDKFFIVSDRAGMFPLYRLNSSAHAPVFGSHPDLLAIISSGPRDYDVTSFCEFIMAGQISYPFTYYKSVSAAEYASVHMVDLHGTRPEVQASTQYFRMTHRPDQTISRSSMAELLSVAIRNAVRRRTDIRLGTVAIGLSGGLDSRMILCACPDPSRVTAFCFYDEENAEYRTARLIAATRGARFIPLKRTFDHYGDSAEAGVMISGGMSIIAANHYLGFRDQLRETGFDNVLTGLFSDFLFKGEAINSRRSIITRNEVPTSFSLAWCFPFFELPSPERTKVNERLENVYPSYLRQDNSEMARLEVESRRLFPLCYEPGNSEELVPQRTIGWYPPILDNEVIDTYLRMPLRFKFDHSMYSEVVKSVCGRDIIKIPDSNTGLPVDATALRSYFQTTVNSIKGRIGRRLKKPQLATSGSWQNSEYYIHHSAVVRELWTRPNAEARDFLSYLLGSDPFSRPITEYAGEEKWLFQRLLTLKIWLDSKRRSH